VRPTAFVVNLEFRLSDAPTIRKSPGAKKPEPQGGEVAGLGFEPRHLRVQSAACYQLHHPASSWGGRGRTFTSLGSEPSVLPLHHSPSSYKNSITTTVIAIADKMNPPSIPMMTVDFNSFFTSSTWYAVTP
jgi:hypothetical protein